jgi:hypothetical protein
MTENKNIEILLICINIGSMYKLMPQISAEAGFPPVAVDLTNRPSRPHG